MSHALILECKEWWPVVQNVVGAVTVAGGWSLPESGAPTPAAYDGSNIVAGIMNFTEAGSESMQRQFRLPSDWKGAIDLALFWRTTATTGNVVWQIATAFATDDDVVDPAFNAAQTIIDAAKGTGSDRNLASLAALTLTGAVAGSLMTLKLFRDPAHASDTLGATASLEGVEVTYRRLVTIG